MAESRRIEPDTDPPASFSTDPQGNFRRTGEEGLYFTEEQSVVTANFGEPESAGERVGLWDLLRPEGGSARSWIPVIAGGLGALLILLGALVLASTGDPAGWFEIAIGALLIGAPLTVAAARLRAIREERRQKKAGREKLEVELRRVVGAFGETLDDLAARPGPETIEAVRREREANPVPAEIVAPLARAAVARYGFFALSRLQELGPGGVAAEIANVAGAVGVSDENARAAKTLVFQKAVWHLLADDRMTDARERLLMEIRKEFGLLDEEIVPELSAIEEFRGLRGVDAKHLPLIQAGPPLKFAEFCHQKTAGTTVRVSGTELREDRQADVYVSQKRVLVAGKARESIDHSEIFGIEVDADRSILELTIRDRKGLFRLRLPDPIRTAQVTALAGTLPPKPKGLI